MSSSHSNIVAAIEDGGSYFSSHRLSSAIFDKVFEFSEHSADRNSSSVMSSLWPYTARRSTHLLQEFGWEVFNHHQPYSSDLAPSDFHLFLRLNQFLSGQRQRFQNDREAEISVTEVAIPGGRLLRHRIQKLIPWYDECFNSGDEYVEK